MEQWDEYRLIYKFMINVQFCVCALQMTSFVIETSPASSKLSPYDTFPTLSKSNILNANWFTASPEQRNDSNSQNSMNDMRLCKISRCDYMCIHVWMCACMSMRATMRASTCKYIGMSMWVWWCMSVCDCEWRVYVSNTMYLHICVWLIVWQCVV